MAVSPEMLPTRNPLGSSGDDEVLLAGQLEKLGGANKDNWQTRYVKLTATGLQWQHASEDASEVIHEIQSHHYMF